MSDVAGDQVEVDVRDAGAKPGGMWADRGYCFRVPGFAAPFWICFHSGRHSVGIDFVKFRRGDQVGFSILRKPFPDGCVMFDPEETVSLELAGLDGFGGCFELIRLICVEYGGYDITVDQLSEYISGGVILDVMSGYREVVLLNCVNAMRGDPRDVAAQFRPIEQAMRGVASRSRASVVARSLAVTMSVGMSPNDRAMFDEMYEDALLLVLRKWSVSMFGEDRVDEFRGTQESARLELGGKSVPVDDVISGRAERIPGLVETVNELLPLGDRRLSICPFYLGRICDLQISPKQEGKIVVTFRREGSRNVEMYSSMLFREEIRSFTGVQEPGRLAKFLRS